MPADSADLLLIVVRATAFLSLGWCVVAQLTKYVQISSVRLLSLCWFTVLIQGVLLFRLPIELPLLSVSETQKATSSVGSQAGYSGGTPLTDTHTMNSENPETAAAEPSRDKDFVPAGFSLLRSHFPQLLRGVWLSGLLSMLVFLIRDYRKLLQVVSSAVPAAAEIQQEWDDVLRGTRYHQHVPVVSLELAGPAICYTPSGYRLLIPQDLWEQLPQPQRQAVLRHELAHLQRRDLWRSLLFRLMASIQWFNPLAWRTVQRLEECAEWACDDCVHNVDSKLTSADYVQALMVFSGASRTTSIFVSGAAGHSLIRRAERLLVPSFRKDPLMKSFLVTLPIAVIVVLNICHVTLVAQDTDPSDEPTTLTLPVQNSAEVPRTPVLHIIAAGSASTDSSVRVQGNSGVSLTAQSIDFLDTPLLTMNLAIQDAADKQESAPQYTEAVIDLAYVFSHYPGFEQLRQDQRKRVEQQETELKHEQEACRLLADRINTARSTEEADTLRRELTERQVRLELDVKRRRQELAVRESENHAAIFRKVRSAIAGYAKEHGIKIVRRATTAKAVDEMLSSTDPGTVVKAMQAEVLYVADDSIDITDEVLERIEAEASAEKHDAQSPPADN